MNINLPAAQTSPVTQIKQQGKYAIIYYKQQMTYDTEKRTTEKSCYFSLLIVFDIFIT